MPSKRLCAINQVPSFPYHESMTMTLLLSTHLSIHVPESTTLKILFGNCRRQDPDVSQEWSQGDDRGTRYPDELIDGWCNVTIVACPTHMRVETSRRACILVGWPLLLPISGHCSKVVSVLVVQYGWLEMLVIENLGLMAWLPRLVGGPAFSCGSWF